METRVKVSFDSEPSAADPASDAVNSTQSRIDDTLKKFEELAEGRKEDYAQASPYPHCCIDGLISDTLLDGVIQEARESTKGEDWLAFEQKGRAHNKVISTAEGLMSAGPNTAELVAMLTSSRFIRALEKLTGIEGIFLDPHFYNSGFHQIRPGGFLKIHRDFFFHHELKIYRRVNLLLYLNKDWKDEYGGYLEMLDGNMENSVKYYPVNNRIVISTVTADALHGNPEPLSCPQDRTRRSLALWYFTSQLPERELLKYQASSSTGWFEKNSLAMDNRGSVVWTVLPPILKEFFISPIEVVKKFMPPFLLMGFNLIRRRRMLSMYKKAST